MLSQAQRTRRESLPDKNRKTHERDGDITNRIGVTWDGYTQMDDESQSDSNNRTQVNGSHKIIPDPGG